MKKLLLAVMAVTLSGCGIAEQKTDANGNVIKYVEPDVRPLYTMRADRLDVVAYVFQIDGEKYIVNPKGGILKMPNKPPK